jgi:hypothetical protein
LIGFGIISGVIAFYNLILSCICLCKCKKRICKKKDKKGKYQKEDLNDTDTGKGIEMEAREPKKGPKYADEL